MAIKKNAPVQSLGDPAVDAAVGEDPIYGKLNRSKVRRTAGQVKKDQRDQARSKVTYDWPPELVERVDAIAREHGVPANQVAALLMKVGLRAYENGEVDLRSRKYPSRSPRFEFFLDMEDEE